MSAWRIKVSGHELREEDVEAGHLIIAADMAGVDGWEVADPMTSPKMLAAWVATVIALNVPGSDATTANLMVAKMKASDLIACYSRDDDVSAPSTTPSNGDIDRAAMLRAMTGRAKA